ncbi:hypothetical protein AAVH_15258 [Aphelenchoides avenae]|nr:hypothetical protein AAVH_15258 [Aphelenchus avenae]
MNALPAVATPGGNLRPAVSPRHLSPPNYAFVQPSENEQLKRQIEERIKELAQKHEELKAADKRAALTDAKAAAAVALAKEKNQQLMEDVERAKDKAEALKKELDEKEALIGELSKENDEILQRMQDGQHPSKDIAEGAKETIDEPPNSSMYSICTRLTNQGSQIQTSP